MPQDSSDPQLLNFFIFNSQLGQKEGHEEEKLLYYYPKSDPLDLQVKQVGLSEAIIRFTGTFNQKDDCEFMHTQKKHQIFLQPEKDIWMVLTVSVGWLTKQKDGSSAREYQSEGVQDSVLKAHLKRAYEAFCFRHHSISYKSVKLGVESLRTLLWNFFNEYVPVTNMSSGDILSLWRGLSFLPSDKQNFLRVHSTLSILQASLPSVIHTALLYDGKFVWCGFGMKDLQSVFYYLESLSKPSSSEQTSDHGSFLGINGSIFEEVYLHSDRDEWQAYRLMVYHKSNISVCLTFPKSMDLNDGVCDKISTLLNGRLEVIAKDIQTQLKSQTANQNGDFKYIYHNHMNLATKTSLSPDNTIPVSTMQTVIDMHHDISSTKTSELVFKTAENFWIVARMSNGRESYVIVNQKSANLIEVSEQVSKMCASHFNNIFMIE